MVLPLKEITQAEIKLLLKNKIIFDNGALIDKNGYPVSYKRTKHRSFIMDEYADIAQSIIRGTYGAQKT